MRDDETRDLEQDQRSQHRNMQRPQPAETADDKSRYFRAFRQSFTIGMRDHKAAEHEEEVDEQPRVADQRLPIDKAMHFQVMGCDEQRADAAPAVERPEAQR